MSQSRPRFDVQANIWARLGAAAAAGAAVGAAVAALSPGNFWPGWLAAFLLLTCGMFALLSAWSWAGGGRLLGWMMALAFLLRLIPGMGLSFAIASAGYDNDCQNAGYIFKDACERDRESFSIAKDNEGLFWFSGIKLDSDQYGGLAFLSGWIYRYLSPDAHRPFLILLIGAIFTALGVPFLRQAVRLHWSDRVANVAAWIYILYPDALFFGSSQIREPFLVGLFSVAFWAVLSWDRHLRTSLAVFCASLLGMMFFSYRVALISGAVLAVLFWLDFSASRSGRSSLAFSWLGLLLGMAGLMFFSWNWFNSSAGFDISQTIKSSGLLTTRIKEIGEQWAFLFTVLYGVVRPFLPAAVADADSLPLLRAVVIFRSLGWYLIVPFLVYGVFTLWREPEPRRRRIAVWLILTVVFWLLIASARGGGDATDNPRYRSLFIVCFALMAAWAADWALTHHDAWLWRWIAVEGIFLGFFTHWYIGRYYRIWARLEFWQMMAWISAISFVILAGGWFYDRRRMRTKTGQKRVSRNRQGKNRN
jgi:hypothetical protein